MLSRRTAGNRRTQQMSAALRLVPMELTMNRSFANTSFRPSRTRSTGGCECLDPRCESLLTCSAGNVYVQSYFPGSTDHS